MTRKPYHPSLIVPVLLAAALLQACRANSTLNMQPEELKGKPIPPLELTASSNKKGNPPLHLQKKITLVHASQSEAKDEHPKQPKSAPTPQRHLPFQSTAATHPASVPVITRQPLPDSERKIFNPFESAGDMKGLLKSTTDKNEHEAHEEKRALAARAEALLKTLKGLNSRDMIPWADCLKEIAKIVSPASVEPVQKALSTAYHELDKAPKDAEYLQEAIGSTLTIIKEMQADLAHSQEILREKVLSTSCADSFPCGCCKKLLKIDFERVNKIRTIYPEMAEAVTLAILRMHKESLLHRESGIYSIDEQRKIFIDYCLEKHPKYTSAICSIISEASSNLWVGRNAIDVLVQLVKKDSEYAPKGILILNSALRDPWSPEIRILALQACTVMLQKKSCTEFVDKKSLCQAFKTLQSALLGSGDKELAEAVLKKINGVPFLREGWERYKKQEGKTTPTDQQLDSMDNLKNALKGMGINM